MPMSAGGLRPRLAGIGDAPCGRCAAIIMQKTECAGCMATVGVSPAAGPSQGLRDRADERAAPAIIDRHAGVFRRPDSVR